MYYSLEKIFLSRLFKKINTYKTIILSETWSLTLREEHRLRVFENKVLKYLGLRGKKLHGNGESYIILSCMHCIPRVT